MRLKLQKRIAQRPLGRMMTRIPSQTQLCQHSGRSTTPRGNHLYLLSSLFHVTGKGDWEQKATVPEKDVESHF